MPNDVDAIVIGASAAGLHAARRLSDSGARVVVLERAVQVGLPTRTLIVTQDLARVMGVPPAGAILHAVRRMDMHAGNARAEITLAAPDWVVDRGRINRHLLDAARSSGAEVRLGEAAGRICLESDGAHVADSGGREWRAGMLVGADGVRSRVGAVLGAGLQRTAPILQAQVRLPAGYDPSAVQIWFDRAATNFFFWLIPDSESTGVLGLVAGAGVPARAALDGFLRAHRLVPLAYQGAVIPLYRPGRRIERRWAGGRALLVGDAAAQVKATTVGGLVSGLWGADAAAESLRTGRPLAACDAAVRIELGWHSLLRSLLDRYSQSDYADLIAGLNPRTRRTLSDINRDHLAAMVMRLGLAQPALAVPALRAGASLIRDAAAGAFRPSVSGGVREPG